MNANLFFYIFPMFWLENALRLMKFNFILCSENTFWLEWGKMYDVDETCIYASFFCCLLQLKIPWNENKILNSFTKMLKMLLP